MLNRVGDCILLGITETMEEYIIIPDGEEHMDPHLVQEM